MKPNQDTENLRLLSVFHYVLAGLIALCAMFPMFHLAVGIAITTGALDDMANGDPPPGIFGWMFLIIASSMILNGLAMASCGGASSEPAVSNLEAPTAEPDSDTTPCCQKCKAKMHWLGFERKKSWRILMHSSLRPHWYRDD